MPADIPMKVENYNPQQAYYATVASNGYLPVILSGSVARINSSIAWEQNTGETRMMFGEETIMPQDPFNNNRQFIKLEQSFDQKLQQYKEVFAGQNDYVLKEKMKVSADAILNCSPDKISLQITNEGGVFYTFLKGDAAIYFQHFLIDEYDDSDEAIVSIFKGDQNIINYAGSLSNALIELHQALFPESINIPELA